MRARCTIFVLEGRFLLDRHLSFQLLFPALLSGCWPSLALPVSQAEFCVVLYSVIDHEQNADILYPHMLIPTADFGGKLNFSASHFVILCIVR